MNDLDHEFLEEVLLAVGEHLDAAGTAAAIVVVGGSALAARGWVRRVTKDVDVIALATDVDGAKRLTKPEPLPPALVTAIQRVARDYGLPHDWMNTAVGAQWRFGLPDGFESDVEWRRFRSLEVGFAGRQSIITLKLFAVVDQGSKSVHYQDLVALRPTHHELMTAAAWVEGQDAGELFPTLLEEAVRHVRDGIAKDRRAREGDRS